MTLKTVKLWSTTISTSRKKKLRYWMDSTTRT